VSAGVIPYTFKDDTYHFLLQHLTGTQRSWSYEDFGGKSQVGDQNIEDVAFRECHEETNYSNYFSPDFLRKQLQHERSVIYQIPECKYMMYFIYVPPEYLSLDLSQFGSTNNDNQLRILEWITYRTLMEMDGAKMQPRFVPAEFKINLPLVLSNHMIGLGKYY
jgi:8-oxo-dGTP pyrophosphatase MutT (NUDIX family)